MFSVLIRNFIAKQLYIKDITQAKILHGKRVIKSSQTYPNKLNKHILRGLYSTKFASAKVIEAGLISLTNRFEA